MQWAGLNVLIGRECSDWREASSSAVSTRFEQIKSVCNIFFHVQICFWLFSLFLSISVSSVLLLFVSLCMSVYEVHYLFRISSWKWGGGGVGTLKITFFWKIYMFGAYILNLLLMSVYITLSFKNQITQICCTNMPYSQWDKACKAWVLNINRSCDFIQMATDCSTPKQEYDDAISNMDPQWAWETVIVGSEVGLLSEIDRYFHRIFFVSVIIIFSFLKFYNTKTQKNSTHPLLSNSLIGFGLCPLGSSCGTSAHKWKTVF